MLNSLIETIFGCAHHRTTFPITPSRNSQRAEGARRATYIVCLDCGKEFDYNWKEMRMGAPSAQAVASYVPDQPALVKGGLVNAGLVEALPIRAEQHVVH